MRDLFDSTDSTRLCLTGECSDLFDWFRYDVILNLCDVYLILKKILSVCQPSSANL